MAKSKPTAPAASSTPPLPEPSAAPAGYTVVARRYRPQLFAELIGQEHVAQSLINALQSGRVAHAYLFTGARGVGKTSAARILAKALNCEKGPTPTPCGQCESCVAVAEGQDVDVLEIDGASNNKVEEIRDLRQNVGFRPTRGRYKIYIIDEVHMLSTQAFNALLKTLEEPPPHVKFIFATTEVQKLPITILSRCQRFDFAFVGPAKILEQLKSIVRREGHEADEDALRLVARRAAGSMRDSQSLLDQLLASAEGKLTAQHVHAVLGTTGDERVAELVDAILAHDAKSALNLIGQWVERGLQVGELVDQLIEHWRALMLFKAGSDLAEFSLAPGAQEIIAKQANLTTLDAILAGIDVWSATKGRMRGSSHGNVLLELAVVRLCRLEELLSVGQLLQTMAQNGVPAVTPARPGGANPASDPSKKNGMTLPRNGLSELKQDIHQKGFASLELSESRLRDVVAALQQHLEEKSPILANQFKFSHSCAIFGPNSLAIHFHSSYNHAYETCRSESYLQKLQDALRQVLGQPTAQVRVEMVGGPAPELASKPATAQPLTARGKESRVKGLPLFQKATEALGAQIRHVDDGFDPAATAAPTAESDENQDDSNDPTDED